VKILADSASFWWDAWQMLEHGGPEVVITPSNEQDRQDLEAAYAGSYVKIHFNRIPSMLLDVKDYVSKEIIRYHGLN
jgi:hypothetical protein